MQVLEKRHEGFEVLLDAAGVEPHQQMGALRVTRNCWATGVPVPQVVRGWRTAAGIAYPTEAPTTPLSGASEIPFS